MASAIWPHGRWRLDFAGEGNHAGTTRMADRHDPMLTFAYTVLAANKEARLAGAHATIGRVAVEPNATNAIPARVTRLARRPGRRRRPRWTQLVDGDRRRRRPSGPAATAPRVARDRRVGLRRDRVRRRRCATGWRPLLGGAPVLPTGAGHDAGVLAPRSVPTAMLFVRNPTGVSHAPAEHATDDDCAAGVDALADGAGRAWPAGDRPMHAVLRRSTPGWAAGRRPATC